MSYLIKMNFLRKFRDFILSPSRSRTMGLLAVLVLVSAVSLTVIVAQQQQTLKQRAASACYDASDCETGYFCNNGKCQPVTGDACTANGGNCIPMGPCVPPSVQDASYSCGNNPNGSVCCTTPSFNCVDKDCFSSQTCIGSLYDDSTYCLSKGVGIIGSYCGKPDKTPNNEACASGYCNPTTLLCSAGCTDTGSTCTDSIETWTDFCNGNTANDYFCGSNGQCNQRASNCPPPTICIVDADGAGCVNPGAPTAPPSDCTESGNTCTDSSGSYTDSCGPTDTNGTAARNYTCANGYCNQSAWYCPPPTICIVDADGAGCVSPNAPTSTPIPGAPTFTPTPTPVAGAPTSTPTPTPTPTPINFVTLVLTLNDQDVASASGDIFADLILYSLKDNSKVPGAPAKQLFTKTFIPGKKYSANITLANLHQDKYFLVVRKNNMIAKAFFTVSAPNETIPVPTKTLVFGDINSDNDINISDYYNDNAFRGCWRKSTTADPSCASSDFDNSGTVEQIDYNTFLRGFSTWSKEGK